MLGSSSLGPYFFGVTRLTGLRLRGYRTRYGSTSDCFREEIMMCRGEDNTQSENKQLSLSDEMP